MRTNMCRKMGQLWPLTGGSLRKIFWQYKWAFVWGLGCMKTETFLPMEKI